MAKREDVFGSVSGSAVCATPEKAEEVENASGGIATVGLSATLSDVLPEVANGKAVPAG